MEFLYKILFVLFTLSLFITVIVLSVLLKQCKDKEKFCVCTGVAKRNVDVSKLKDLYNSGERTEYTDFAELQNENGGAKWVRLSGSGYDTPFSEYEESTPKCS